MALSRIERGLCKVAGCSVASSELGSTVTGWVGFRRPDLPSCLGMCRDRGSVAVLVKISAVPSACWCSCVTQAQLRATSLIVLKIWMVDIGWDWGRGGMHSRIGKYQPPINESFGSCGAPITWVAQKRNAASTALSEAQKSGFFS